DLGGHRTVDGGETRFGALVRADSVSQLSEAGWEALTAYGVRTVLDLRGEHERDDDPPGDLPVEVLHVPFMEASEAEWEAIEEELERLRRIAQTPKEAMLGVFVELERRHGSVEGYLRSTGLTDDELDRLRVRLHA